MPHKSLDEQFSEIAEAAIKEAEHVKCSFPAFVAGLKTMVSDLRERLRLAEDELAGRDGEA